MFNELPVVLGENFAQILPIVKNGTQASIVNTCLQYFFLQKQLYILTLQQNIRLQTGNINAKFAAWLSKLSYDLVLNDLISLLSFILQMFKFFELYKSVFLYR